MQFNCIFFFLLFSENLYWPDIGVNYLNESHFSIYSFIYSVIYWYLENLSIVQIFSPKFGYNYSGMKGRAEFC